MQFPSIDLVVSSALRTARRFPFVLAAATAATFAGLASTVSGSGTEATRLIFVATLGLPLLFALTVFAERSAATSKYARLVPFAGVAVLVAFWWMWSGWASSVQALRYTQLSLAFHLLAAFAPYTGSNRPNGFWQYNRILFLRFLTAGLYAVVLFAGLAIALVALDKLFGVRIPPQSYLRLWIIIAFLFCTWFFLGGIPEKLEELDERIDYPTGLRIFTQYVLVPIVALYLTILTLYLAKVLFTRQWPNGWIGYLVSSVAAVGLLSWLLVYPLEDRAEYGWVRTYTRGFYIALMPAIVMLWFAIYERVAEYGITEPRYFLIVLSCWLAAIAAWFTFTRSRNIKLIPASLCVVAIVTFAGPVGAYAVSRRSQLSRLESVLQRNDLLANGRLRQGSRPVSQGDRKEISGTLRYLLEAHGPGALGSLLPDSLGKTLQPLPSTYAASEDAKRIMAAFNLQYVTRGYAGPADYFSFATQGPRDAVAIEGYRYALRLPYWNVHDSLRVGDNYVLRFSSDSTSLQLFRGANVALTIPMRAVLDSATAFQKVHGGVSMPPEVLRLQTGEGDLSVLANFTMIAGYARLDGPRFTSLAGEIFLRLK